jgi:hypothetical protein
MKANETRNMMKKKDSSEPIEALTPTTKILEDNNVGISK